ncbi:hypothetical protein HK101_005432, partial [Irineochytrium annulatum]
AFDPASDSDSDGQRRRVGAGRPRAGTTTSGPATLERERNRRLRQSNSNPELAKQAAEAARLAEQMRAPPLPTSNKLGIAVVGGGLASTLSRRGRSPSAAVPTQAATTLGRSPVAALSQQQTSTGQTATLGRNGPLKSAMKAPRVPTEREIREAEEAERAAMEKEREVVAARRRSRSGSRDGRRSASRDRRRRSMSRDRGGSTNRDRGGSMSRDRSGSMSRDRAGSMSREPSVDRGASARRGGVHVKGVIDRDHIVAVIVSREMGFDAVRKKITDKVAAMGHPDAVGDKAVLDGVKRKDDEGNLITLVDEEDWEVCLEEAEMASAGKVTLILDVSWV